MNLFDRFKAIFYKPTALFNAIKKENDFKPTLYYYLIFVLGVTIVTYLINSAKAGFLNLQFSVISWISSIIGTFVFAFFIGFIASWFKGDRNWIQGLKAITYPQTIFSVFGLLIAAIMLLMPVDLSFLSDPTKLMANLPALMGIGIAIVAIALALLVWVIVLCVKGIKISNNLTAGKAFATLVISFIFYLIVIGIIEWVFMKIGLMPSAIAIG